MHRRWGKLAWAKILAPSVKLAAEGFVLSPRVAGLLAGDSHLPQNPAARALWYEADGTAKKPARSSSIRRSPRPCARSPQSGAGAFYAGPIARDIAQAVAHADPPGDLGEGDLASYKVKERAVLCRPYRGTRVCGMGLPSGEEPMLEILGLVEPFDLRGTTSPTPRRGISSRPPAGLPMPTARAGSAIPISFGRRSRGCSIRHISRRARSSSIRRICPPARRRRASPRASTRDLWGDERAPEFPSTSNISVIDRDGNAVAMTATIESNFGSHVMVRGFLLNNELTDFSFVPEADGRTVANRVEPEKRPLSAMAPTMVFAPDGKLMLVVGSAGGPAIITDVAKAIIGVVDWHMSLKDAIALPNVDNRNGPTEIETYGGAPALGQALEAMGHTIRVWRRESGLGGILVTPQGLEGATDPRREGAALGD